MRYSRVHPNTDVFYKGNFIVCGVFFRLTRIKTQRVREEGTRRGYEKRVREEGTRRGYEKRVREEGKKAGERGRSTSGEEEQEKREKYRVERGDREQ
ncbi:hypothetical protein RRG08_065429 [Elysia crispata]|uniref:Uncharacterized protein n=1 Tax=Elysia crispata TaxID=231223 RepID=A0AAE0ZEP0_9GAST|nr:hypothetical protein RRG08_065429 [Elysia crispata]